MKENKLIAEFMNVHEIMHDGYSEYDFDDNTLDVVHENNLKYHSSWDWLMPVVEKCFDGLMENDNWDDLNFSLNDALLTTNIDEVYKAVINIIKQIK